MAVRRIAAESLLELVTETLERDLAPDLPAEKRYLAAMIANALRIARRDIVSDGDSGAWALFDVLYPEGEGTAANLASDLRLGRVTDRTHADLRDRLRAMLVAELKIKNPKFLAARGVRG